MKYLKKISYLLPLLVLFAAAAAAQDRPRVVKSVSSQPINQPPVPLPQSNRNATPASSSVSNQPARSISRPILTNQIVVAPRNDAAYEPVQLVKKTAAVSASSAMAFISAGRTAYSSAVSHNILRGIQSRLGIPYLYGSSGPNRYDCSGFVWAVFNEAGVPFTRASARSLWGQSVPVDGQDRYKFGTLVFLNGLGHMGIVADENGFYHASSSKGITYSPFKGYWEKRIVGFRRLPQMGQEITPETDR